MKRNIFTRSGPAGWQPNATRFFDYRVCRETGGADPPGPRGTPSSRSRNNGVSIWQGASRPTGASAADRGVRPTIYGLATRPERVEYPETSGVELRYAVVIEKTNTGYSAYVPDLPGCVSVGRTRAEMDRNIREAIELYLDELGEQGAPIPASTTDTEYVAV